MQVVWFKRDLRTHDHRALAYAAERGDVLPLYVVEPELWAGPDMSGRHWAFVAESLQELQEDCAARGQALIVRMGDMCEVLSTLRDQGMLTALWSHEETGNAWTFERDTSVGAWCRAHGVLWTEVQNHGVQRRLASRNGWAGSWDRLMAEPQVAAPDLKPLDVEPGHIPNAKDLRLSPDPCAGRQVGGRQAGLSALESFLHRRGQTYRSAMSSPVSGATACSRVSPYLAWGALSMREVAQDTWARKADVKGQKGWAGSMRSFEGRLHWHCHFMQKLEDDPRIEFENFHRAYNGVRPKEPDHLRLEAWAKGETGLPFL
ncbi:MAG: deoxyribodipyrimidine photo-lyase, partial [Pseudomonadota bacterium]